MIEILKRTPPWVFLLFFVLLALGYVQSKDRKVSRRNISILPIVMVGLSFYGVLSAFGLAPVAVVCWALGVAITVSLGVKLAGPRGVTWSMEAQVFSVPGSWLPLTLMMAIFFTKYAVGVAVARRLPVVGEPIFVSLVSLCYGLLSGVFLARAIVISQSAKR